MLGSLGLYEISPGSSDYALGSPLFQKVTVPLDNDGTGTAKPLTITARNNAKENVYVHQVYWNNQLLEGVNSISFDLLHQGGELAFVMGAKPASSSTSQAKSLRHA